MCEIIVITSGKGGVGKTTVTANIGLGLANLNKKVVVVDTDIGLRNLDVVLGLENRIVYNLIDVIEGSCRMKQALIRDKHCENLYLLPSAQTRDKTSVKPEQMVKLTKDLAEEFDYILLDCPAGIEQGFKNAIAGANRAVVVTTPEVSAIRDADRIIGLLQANQMPKIELIINRLRMDMIQKGEDYEKLRKSFVIFICTFDPFNKGRHIYTFQNRCYEDSTLTLGDETTKVFLNTKGELNDVNEEMIEFLNYIENSTDDYANQAKSQLVKEINQKVSYLKSDKSLEVEYMTLYERDKEKFKEGHEQGLQEGLEQGIEKNKIENAKALLDILDDETIASKIELPLETVQKLRTEILSQ